ncbi:MAG TPA: TIGR01777 family oxidoreductase [Polyangiaceae bacterium]|nr:TIGR01777 family oxidoreductase [Polyangiaceae bacterium]
MRVLLTGGTGFIGSHLARALEARGDQVVVVSRRGPVTWDDVEARVSTVDAVVHLAGEPVADARWTPERLERIRASRVDTTGRLARAIAAAPRKPRAFVSASAVGIYGTRTDDVVCRESTPPGDDVLARIVVDWEAAAAPAREAGVRVAHPRTGIVLGPGGALSRMVGPYRFFVGGSIGSGKQWVSWIHLHDEVSALLFLLDRDIQGPVNLVAPEPVTMAQLSSAIGRTMHRPSLMRVPGFALKVALGSGVAQLLLTGQRVAPAALQAAGFSFAFARIDEALRDLL